MLNSIKTSVKDTFIYGLGNIAVKLVGLVLIPIFADPKYFTVEEFGIIGVLDITSLALIAIMALFIPQSFARWYWDKEHKENQKGIFFLTYFTQVIASIILCILLLPLSELFSVTLFDKADYSQVIKFVIIASAIQVINNVVNTHMRLQSRSTLYIITNVGKLIVVLALSIYFIIPLRMGLSGIYLAQLIGNALYVVALFGYTVKNSSIFLNFKVFREMNLYGLPLFLGSVSAVALTAVDRFALNGLSVLKSVAIYTLAYKITSVLKVVIADSVKFAVGPLILKKMDASDNRLFYAKTLLYSSYIMMIAIVGISAFSLEIIDLITKTDTFSKALVIVPVLSISIFFMNMKEVTIYGLHIAKKSKIIGIIIIISTVVSILLNLLLIPLWDITGAAVATLLSQIFYWGVCYWYAQKAYKIPYETGKILILLITGILFSYLTLLFNDMALIPRLALKTASIAAFPVILYYLKFYDDVEIKAIKGFIIKWSDLSNIRRNIASLKGINDDE